MDYDYCESCWKMVLVGKQFMDEMFAALPLMLDRHLSDNTNQWERVFKR